jgi:hypothetical protein
MIHSVITSTWCARRMQPLELWPSRIFVSTESIFLCYNKIKEPLFAGGDSESNYG